MSPWREYRGLDVLQTGDWWLPDRRALPAPVEAFIEDEDPAVYVGFGSMPAPKGLAQAAVDAAHGLGLRVVLGRGWAGLDAQPERRTVVVREINQQALFRRVAAVVHHGGAGTTSTAARAGVPQVVVPQIGDQHYWAGRVHDLGIEAAHDGAVPTADSLSRALRTVLDDRVRSRAVEVGTSLAEDGASRAASLLRHLST